MAPPGVRIFMNRARRSASAFAGGVAAGFAPGAGAAACESPGVEQAAKSPHVAIRDATATCLQDILIKVDSPQRGG